jgi:hypothetical protein
MNSKNIKRGSLAALTLVLIYIWWGNLKMFTGHTEQDEMGTIDPPQHRSDPTPKRQYDYQSPKANPFLRTVKAAIPLGRQSAPPKPTVPFVHETHQLSGVLHQKRRSQAILLAQGASRIVEAGDTVSHWRVESIGDSLVTFSQGKRRDTLRLGYHK